MKAKQLCNLHYRSKQQEKVFSRVKTTRKTGGLTWPYKGLLLAAPQGAAFSSFKPGASIT